MEIEKTPPLPQTPSQPPAVQNPPQSIEIVKAVKKDGLPDNRGGAREGAGRKKGGKNQLTVEREALQDKYLRERSEQIQHFTDRIGGKLNRIFDAQFSLAVGVQYLFRIDKVILPSGKEGEKHVLVKDPDEIREFLDGDDTGTYYYMTTEKPDNAAAESLLNRYMGRAAQTIAVPEGAKAPTIAIINYGDTDSL